jgi:hypothetical protein
MGALLFQTEYRANGMTLLVIGTVTLLVILAAASLVHAAGWIRPLGRMPYGTWTND